MPRFVGRAPEIKRAAAALARVSEAGTFEGYASLFGVVDTANDEVVRGAFRDSLQKRGAAGVKMLWQHQAAEPIGSWLEIAEDARGLKVVGRLNLAVARAREVLALMREGAVDGLSIGFRTERASLDRSSGVRRLHQLDLWEISIVTFPALPQARVSAIKDSSSALRASSLYRTPATFDVLCMKLARLRAHHAAANFEVKLLRLSRALETRYSPDQPRVPAGSPQGGQWTSEGGGSASGGATDAGGGSSARPSNERVRVAQNDTGVVSDAGDATVTPIGQGDASRGYFVDLLAEEDRGGHAIEKHVGKSDEFLLNRVRTERYSGPFFDIGLQAAGSFSSLAAANKLVNATLSAGGALVDAVAKGLEDSAVIERFFDSPTGKQAYANSGRSQPYIRDTFGVRVVIRYDDQSPNGFTVVTAFPINEGD